MESNLLRLLSRSLNSSRRTTMREYTISPSGASVKSLCSNTTYKALSRRKLPKVVPLLRCFQKVSQMSYWLMVCSEKSFRNHFPRILL